MIRTSTAPRRGEDGKLYLKSSGELAVMRRAGHLLQRIMHEVWDIITPGITTLELDKLAHSRIKASGAKPGFLNLYNFPNTLCISVNEAVVHGIPGKRKLIEGDIVSIDCGLILQGFYADTAFTVPVGHVSAEAEKLLQVTKASLQAGINAAQPGGRVGDIGAEVERVVQAAGFTCVEDYTGHGIGRELHEEPRVYNTSKERGRRLVPGMTMAIEPMVNAGGHATRELDDKWTVVTADNSLSAHFEHTVAITNNGVEILTFDPELGRRW